jgi:hypothetical protein
VFLCFASCICLVHVVRWVLYSHGAVCCLCLFCLLCYCMAMQPPCGAHTQSKVSNASTPAQRGARRPVSELLEGQMNSTVTIVYVCCDNGGAKRHRRLQYSAVSSPTSPPYQGYQYPLLLYGGRAMRIILEPDSLNGQVLGALHILKPSWTTLLTHPSRRSRRSSHHTSRPRPLLACQLDPTTLTATACG